MEKMQICYVPKQQRYGIIAHFNYFSGTLGDVQSQTVTGDSRVR